MPFLCYDFNRQATIKLEDENKTNIFYEYLAILADKK